MRLSEPQGRSPFLAGRDLHLPVCAPAGAVPSEPVWYRAASAHAAAHLAFSPTVFDGRGLGPIVRALMGVLEDTRVELLAGSELPGLLQTWRSLHCAQPGDGHGFEPLLRRLARALIDPGYVDPHTWIAKGRALCLDAHGAVRPELNDPAQLRQLATRLGHDIGQMRLRFNAKTFVPTPDYRDDLRWMWPSGNPQESPAVPSPYVATADPPDVPPPSRLPLQTDALVCPYPEWDRLIGRFRPAWAVVHDWPVERLDQLPAMRPLREPDVQDQARIVQALRRHGQRRPRAGALSEDGERLDLDAAVRSAASGGRPLRPAGRIWRHAVVRRRGERTMLVIDISASSADPWLEPAEPRISLLQASCQVALGLACALQTCGVSVAIVAFSSEGRQSVCVQRVLDFGETFSAHVITRLERLVPGHSTRLGASLRHAARRTLEASGRGAARVVLIGDAQPWDIDLHDPRYLGADARMAVVRARRSGVSTSAIVLDPDAAAGAAKIFGAGGCAVLRSLHELPGVVQRIGL